MTHPDRDEHSPYYDPDEIWEEEIPGIHWVILPIAVALILALLMGCDSAEYDRLQAAADRRDRIARACVPEEGQKIIVTRDGQTIYYRRIQTSPRYGRDFPHVEVKLNLIEEL